MTTLEETVDKTLEIVRDLKQDMVTAGEENTDLATTLLALRGENLVAIAQPPAINRDQMLQTAQMMATGFAPDLLVVVFETFHTTHRTNPFTGNEWQHGEMQTLIEEHDGRAKGWVDDALLVCAYNRAGDSLVQWLPYRIEGTAMHWGQPPENEGRNFSGAVHETMLRSMIQPTLDATMFAATGLTGADFDLDAEQTIAHTDCAVVKILADFGILVALWAKKGSEREQIIKNSLGEPVGLDD